MRTISIRRLFIWLAVLLFIILLAGYGMFVRMGGRSVVTGLVDRADEAVLSILDPKANQPGDVPSVSHMALILDQAPGRESVSAGLSELDPNIPLILTVEMWGGKRYSKQSYGVLQAVKEGLHDGQIEDVCTAIKSRSSATYLRWNPEMELPVSRHPWENSPIQYISAFRHVATLCRRLAPDVLMTWGPAGYPGAMEFWPGKEFVDAASVTVRGASEALSKDYPEIDDLATLVKRKVHRLRFMDKPILILGSERTSAADWPSLLTSELYQLASDSIVYGFPKREPEDISRQKRETLRIGLYDPQELLVDDDAVSVEHLFVGFRNLANGEFETAFEKVLSRGHDVIVTVEPMSRPPDAVDRSVLTNIVLGKYDDEFAAIYRIVSNRPATVYLRFAHEMEIPITRYPWQSQNPVEYIHAFRYFMQLPKNRAPNIVRIWGPAGDRGSIEFWPGDDVVDEISMAIYGLPDKNITDPEAQHSFKDIYGLKAYRLRFIDKPIFITEFGVKGPEAFQTRWLEGAARTIVIHPEILGVNYFNMVDNPGVWGDIKAPDWSITASTLHRFVELLQ